MRILFTLTIFFGSALLFLIQPMIGRIILPTFGGSPAVWTTSMVAFQGVLLAGYAYAHFSHSWLGSRRQTLVHIPVMALSLLTLPFATHVATGPNTGQRPVLGVLGALLSMIGAVFFTVSAGAPLLQRWFSTLDDPSAQDPYVLYSASNLGSLIALVAYPLIVEPQLSLSQQTHLWAAGYCLLLVFMTLAALAVRRIGKPEVEATTTVFVPNIRNPQRAMWLILGAIPSSLLLGVTAYLTTNIAPIPLLWVIPLALYLITFILSFARHRLLSTELLSRILPWLITPLGLAVILEASSPMIPLGLLHLGTFFVAAWMCHSRLNESKPDPSHLTEFYLFVSLGGVLGGLFNAVIAPAAFTTLIEYPLVIALVCFVRPPRRADQRNFTEADAAFPVILGFATFALTAGAKLMNYPPSLGRTTLTIGLPLMACLVVLSRPTRFALSIAAVMGAAFAMHTMSGGAVLYSARSFFGVHRVLGKGKNYHIHELVHGTTTHGMQDSHFPLEPLTYFTESGPIGGVFREFHGAKAKENVAVAGLGVGSVAAYGEPNHNMTFFEIDSVVKDIASNPKYFTYLSDSKAHIRIVLGDARLTIAFQPRALFGIILLDAFSSDAIPVHLLTKEAFHMYLSKLAPHGILVFNITNRFLKLSEMLSAMADDLNLRALRFKDGSVSAELRAHGKSASDVVIMARDARDFDALSTDPRWKKLDNLHSTRIWTDDYANILESFHPTGN